MYMAIRKTADSHITFTDYSLIIKNNRVLMSQCSNCFKNI